MKYILAMLLMHQVNAYCQTIVTVAGSGAAGFSGDSGQAKLATFNKPNSMAFDKDGNLYVVDCENCRIRKITPSGIVNTIAGTGEKAYSGDGEAATLAKLYGPAGIAVDTVRNCLYICTGRDHRIRKINADGVITTIAGTGSPGYNGDNILAISAKLNYPYIGFVDVSGNLYFGDYNNHRVRKISLTGIITTVAGNGTAGNAGDGGPATNAQLRGVGAVSLSPSGELFIPDNASLRIRKVDATGIITTFAGNGNATHAGDGGPATDASFALPNHVAFDQAGNVFIAATGSQVIRMVNPAGIISTVAGTPDLAGFAGDNGPAAGAKFDWPNYLACDKAGNIFVADLTNNRIRRITYNPVAVPSVPAQQTLITITPNPAHSQATISGALPLGTISLTDATGREVLSMATAACTASVSIAYLPTGLYTIALNGLYAGKIVKE